MFGFLQTSGSVRIVKAFHKIKSRKARQLLVEMAEELADAILTPHLQRAASAVAALSLAIAASIGSD